MERVTPAATLASRLRGFPTRLAALAARLRRRRVPVLLQSSLVECGAACLAMVLGYYGHKTRVAECAKHCGVGRDGVTARKIAQAARDYGLRVRALSVEPSHFARLQLPAIVHWEFNHFVVVERWSPQAVDIIDPAVGRRRLRADEFCASMTGVVLLFEPGIHFSQRGATAPALWRRYLGAVWETPGLIPQIVGASLLLQLLGLALPLFTKVIVDQHHDISMLRASDVMTILAVGVLLVMLIQIVTSYLRATLLMYLQAQVDSRIMLGFFEHLMSLPYRFFQQRTSGDLLLRLSSNVPIREVLTNQIIASLLDGLMVLVYLVVLLTQDLTFGAIVLATGVLQVALLSTTRRVRDLLQRDLAAQSETQSYLVEALSGVVTLKASGAEDRALEHWTNLFTRQLNISLQRSHLAAMIETAMGVIRTFSPILLLWIGTQRVLDGAMSLGTMLALNVIATAFLTPLASLVASAQRLQLVGAHFERLADIFEAEAEQDIYTVQPAPQLSGRIEIQHVSFRYDDNGPLTLHDVSIDIAPGQIVALVGATGSGKSTLAKLLLGLYTPSEGEIRYDGQRLQELNYRTLRRQIGVVLQESLIFSGSIRQALTLNDPTLPFEQLVASAQLAAIHDDILRMPLGYETPLSEGASTLSGGQRQRLAIARALASSPPILVLDEATSHLDTATEALIEHNLRQLTCTRIIIAHRLSTIRNADHIIVLDGGRIVEQGTHETLLAHGKHYAALIQRQTASSPADSAAPALAVT